jgi:hypothetical protein
MSMPRPKRLVTSTGYKHAPRQEQALAKRVGGAVTPGSGNQEVKGDVRVKSVVRLECKCTEAKSFTVTRAMVDAITEAAETSGELPVIQVEFLPIKGHPGGRLVICPDYVVDAILNTSEV